MNSEDNKIQMYDRKRGDESMIEAINQSPDYLRGLADGYKEGFNATLEQLHCLSQQHTTRIELNIEKLEELKKGINDIPMPIECINFEEWKPIVWYDKKGVWEE